MYLVDLEMKMYIGAKIPVTSCNRQNQQNKKITSPVKPSFQGNHRRSSDNHPVFNVGLVFATISACAGMIMGKPFIQSRINIGSPNQEPVATEVQEPIPLETIRTVQPQISGKVGDVIQDSVQTSYDALYVQELIEKVPSNNPEALRILLNKLATLEFSPEVMQKAERLNGGPLNFNNGMEILESLSNSGYTVNFESNIPQGFQGYAIKEQKLLLIQNDMIQNDDNDTVASILPLLVHEIGHIKVGEEMNCNHSITDEIHAYILWAMVVDELEVQGYYEKIATDSNRASSVYNSRDVNSSNNYFWLNFAYGYKEKVFGDEKNIANHLRSFYRGVPDESQCFPAPFEADELQNRLADENHPLYADYLSQY